jgi:hypothetical protein
MLMSCTFKSWIQSDAIVSREDLLKVPNRESFDPRFFTAINHIWVATLGLEQNIVYITN